jgi:hypothetical protein
MSLFFLSEHRTHVRPEVFGTLIILAELHRLEVVVLALRVSGRALGGGRGVHEAFERARFRVVRQNENDH